MGQAREHRPSRRIHKLFVLFVVVSTLPPPVSASTPSPNNLQHNNLQQANPTSLPPPTLSSNNTTPAFKHAPERRHLNGALSLRPTRLKSFNKRSVDSQGINNTGFYYPDSLYSCLTSEQQRSLNAANVISTNLSFLILFTSLDLNAQRNISKACSFHLPQPNPLSDNIKPLLTHNTTHLQGLSSLVSNLLTSSPNIDATSLETVLNSYKPPFGPLTPFLRIVLQNKSPAAIDGISLGFDAEPNDKNLFALHQNLLHGSGKSFSQICKKGFEASQGDTVLWHNATYQGLSHSWMLGFSVAVLDCDDADRPVLRGFIKQEFSLDMLNINPCTTFHPSSALHHKCPQNLQCVAKKDRRHFYAGSYTCGCVDGGCVERTRLKKTAATTLPWIEGRELETQYINSLLYNHNNNNNNGDGSNNNNNHNNNFTYTCVACPASHSNHHNYHTSHGNHSCSITFNVWIRGVPLAAEALTLTVCVALVAAVFKHRKTKLIKASVWLLLVTVVVGCFFIHIAVVLRYFEASASMCILIPWLREVGFVVVYGSLTLKVYKVLAEFQSRKAHRAQVRDKDLLRGLLVMVVVVVGYMAAWTAVTIDSEVGYFSHHNYSGYSSYNHYDNWNYDSNRDIDDTDVNANSDKNKLDNSQNSNFNYNNHISHNNYSSCGGTSHNEWSLVRWNRVGDSVFMLCRCAWWDVAIETVEILFLVWGLRLCYRARTAPCIQNEVSSITIVIANELIVSFIFFVIRYCLWLHLHSDHLFLMFFIRAQLTTTPLLCAILAPKLWYVNKNIESGSLRVRGLSTSEVADNQEAVKLNAANNGEVDVNEMRIEDMSADDIRAELKRVYTQLQIYKTKSLRVDNPHISRKKGGKKQVHRRFSLQTFHNKHKRQATASETATADAEASKTPEESTNSVERGSVCMEDGELSNRRSSFKRHHSKSKV